MYHDLMIVFSPGQQYTSQGANGVTVVNEVATDPAASMMNARSESGSLRHETREVIASAADLG